MVLDTNLVEVSNRVVDNGKAKWYNKFIENNKRRKQMTIAQMQNVILGLGWQFQEQVFNDGKPNNCMIDFSRDKSPHALDSPKAADCIGWGRFPRQECWQMAYDAITTKYNT